jgi:hypothetical protein
VPFNHHFILFFFYSKDWQQQHLIIKMALMSSHKL